ncbi:MAG: glycoside hydrolase family 38 C-terminal domain-containing protein [Verrucomicrobiota bacterium]
MQTAKQEIIIHMIGNAHLDPAWLWRWPDGVQEAIATFRSAIDRLKESPDFVFTRGEAWIFEQIEECAPELFEEIARYVKEGRIAIVNGWIVQTDCNLPCGESFVRQALYGKAYFRDKFGVDIKVAYSVDAFGHHANLPQILQKCGYELYIFTRPLSENSDGFKVEKSLPSTMFWWEAAEGSRVLAFHIPCWAHGSYGIHIDDLGEHIRATLRATPANLRHTLCMFGVGNHGGGPTKRQIAYIREHAGDFPNARLVFSHPQQFLDAVKNATGQLPVVRDELNPTMTGCYTSCSEVKKLNRQTESLLLVTERWSTVGALLLQRMPYPSADLRHAWKQLLFNQFHDILAGTSIREVYDDARDMYGQARVLARRQLNRAVRMIAADVDTRGEGIPLIVFNPSTWRRIEALAVEPYLGAKGELGWREEDFKIIDEKGVAIDAQLVKARDNTGGIAAWLFTADIPPMGYRTYRITKKPAREALCRKTNDLQADRTRLRNRFLEIELDPDTGWIRGLRDLQRNMQVLRAPGNVPVVLRDESDTWGTCVQSYRDELARIHYSGIRMLETGPLRARLWLEGFYGRSRIATTITLYRDCDLVFFSTRVEWMEKFTMLKLAFPFNLDEPRTSGEIPYGSIRRSCDGMESPIQSWILVSGKAKGASLPDYGVALINDSKHACDVMGAELRLTVLRCVPHAYVTSCNLKNHPNTPFLDEGTQEFNYAIKLQPESPAVLFRLAEEIHAPLFYTPETIHAGVLAPSGVFLETTASHTLVEVLKKTEAGSNICLRLFETDGRQERFNVILHNGDKRREIRIEMLPNEIKTVVLDNGFSGTFSSETDLLETGYSQNRRQIQDV